MGVATSDDGLDGLGLVTRQHSTPPLYYTSSQLRSRLQQSCLWLRHGRLFVRDDVFA